MMRGDMLAEGITIVPDGDAWIVLCGEKRWRFAAFEDLIEWLEDQYEGLKIARMIAR